MRVPIKKQIERTWVDSIHEYKYKDFSTGRQGSKIDIIQELFTLSYSQALFRIIEEQKEDIKELREELKNIKNKKSDELEKFYVEQIRCA